MIKDNNANENRQKLIENHNNRMEKYSKEVQENALQRLQGSLNIKEIPDVMAESFMKEFEENKASVLKEIDDLMEECRRRIAEEEAKKKDD